MPHLSPGPWATCSASDPVEETVRPQISGSSNYFWFPVTFHTHFPSGCQRALVRAEGDNSHDAALTSERWKRKQAAQSPFQASSASAAWTFCCAHPEMACMAQQLEQSVQAGQLAKAPACICFPSFPTSLSFSLPHPRFPAIAHSNEALSCLGLCFLGIRLITTIYVSKNLSFLPLILTQTL